METKVFISYSSNEMEIAGQVCDYLEQNGVQCWMAPRNINPGGNYATQIVHAIRSCAILLLLASESTNASGHVSNEVSLAFDSKKVIIPFKIEDVLFSDEYLYFLGRKHWIEAHRDMKAGLERLLITIQTIVGMQTTDNVSVKEIQAPPPETITAVEERAFDKAQEIADTLFSREEIVEHILSRAGKYSDNQTKRFASGERFARLKDHANRFLSSIYTVYRYNKPQKVDRVIDYFISEILGDDDAEVIKVTGPPGCGKSVLMQLTFYQALLEFAAGKSKYLPFYIGLGYFEKARYDQANLFDQAKALMKKEMAEYLSYIRQHKEVAPLLFVDDVREHVIGKLAIENVLTDIIQDYDIYKRVIAIDSGLIKNKGRTKRVIPIVSERVSALFEGRAIDSHDEQAAKLFIDSVAAYYEYEISTEEIYKVIKELKFQDFDVFLVRSLADKLLSSPEKIVSISDMYEKWALAEYYGDEDSLRIVAESVFDYLFNQSLRVEELSFNAPQWILIHKHESYIDFLIAYYIIKEIDGCATPAAFYRELFGIMFTASTGAFFGSFLEGDYQLQKKIYQIVLEQFESLEIIQKSSAVYWLAKLKYNNLVADASYFLKEKYNELWPIVKEQDNTLKENYDRQFYFRAICYTLINFGQLNVLDNYLCLLVINGSANDINRGAIVEYFGDQHKMFADDSYYLDTNIMIGERAIRALSWRLSTALQHGLKKYPEIDLLTLTTLLQMRIQSNESKKIPQLRNWVSDAIAFIKRYKQRPQNINSAKIEFYFDSVYDDFCLYLNSADGFDISQILYNTLRNLKDVKRKQWTQKHIQDPESVSEHLYSTWLLAMLFLPNELNREDYSKQEVLDMLLIHDMAEAEMGDQLIKLNEPSKDLRSQNAIMRKLMVKGSYPNVANLTHYYNVWTGYYSGLNINSRIARDINLIQTVYTFCEYFLKYPERFSDEDKQRWLAEKGNLETDVGYVIFEKLVEKNLAFAEMFATVDSRLRYAVSAAQNEPVREPAAQSDSQPRPAVRDQAGADDVRVASYKDILASSVDLSAIKAEIADIVNNVLPSEDSDSLEENLKMLESISDNWRVLLNKQGQLLGYWLFVALPQEMFEEAKRGELHEKDITLMTIEHIDFPGIYKGYLLFSGIKPEVRTAALVQQLYGSLVMHLQYLAERGIFFDEIGAVGESPMGISALRKLGLTDIAEHKYGGKVFVCSLKHMSENKYFSTFGPLTRLYEQFFADQG